MIGCLDLFIALFLRFFSISYPNTIICGNIIFSPHETLLLLLTLTNSCCQWTPLLFRRLLFCLLTLKIVTCMNMGRYYFSVEWVTCQWLYRLKKMTLLSPQSQWLHVGKQKGLMSPSSLSHSFAHSFGIMNTKALLVLKQSWIKCLIKDSKIF